MQNQFTKWISVQIHYFACGKSFSVQQQDVHKFNKRHPNDFPYRKLSYGIHIILPLCEETA